MKIKVFNSRKLNTTQEVNLVLATNNQKRECIIGRSPSSSIVLDSPDVSRLHGKFFQQEEKYYFCDLGSRNGSIVNGKLAEINQTYPIKTGDILRIGEFVLILEELDVIREDLAEVAFGSVDATGISNWRSLTGTPPTQNIPRVQKEKVIPPLVSPEVVYEPRVNSQSLNTIGEPTEILAEQIVAEPTSVQLPGGENEVANTSYCLIPAVPKSDTLSAEEMVAIGDRPTVIEVFEDLETNQPQPDVVADEAIAISERPTAIEIFEDLETNQPQPDIDEMPEISLAAMTPSLVDVLLEADPWEETELEPAINPALIIAERLKQTAREEVLEIAMAAEVSTPEETESQLTSQKYIALIADDSKKIELVQFVSQHADFFSQCLTVATPGIGDTLYQIAGVAIAAEAPAEPGGERSISALVDAGDVLAVILLQDVLQLPKSKQANTETLLGLCDRHQVLCATNRATAEAIVHYIKSIQLE